MSRGRKPNLDNVAQLPRRDAPAAVHFAIAEDLKPDWLTEAEAAAWDRVAPQLAMLGRLKAHFVDALAEYCRIVVRLRDARRFLDDSDWTYVTSGRNGTQVKSRPEVAQMNEDWRKWRSLVGEFGLAPAAERGVSAGQMDIFDDFDQF